jgi:hypothetical protein
MPTIKNLFERLENIDISFGWWIGAFIAIIFIRFFLETFSSPSSFFPAAPDIATMVHYFLFFLGVFFSLAFVLGLFVGSIKKITKLLLFGFPIIWLAPIIDLFLSHGGGYAMAYMFPTSTSFPYGFLTMSGLSIFGGLTPGIRIEVFAILVGIFFYLLTKTKFFLKAIAGTILSYGIVFAWLSVPAILGFLIGLFLKSTPGFSGFAQLIGFFLRIAHPS